MPRRIFGSKKEDVTAGALPFILLGLLNQDTGRAWHGGSEKCIHNFNRDYCVFEPCPSFGILSNTTFRKRGLFLSSGERVETPAPLGPLE
jgi:hypothetical protein